MIGGWTLLMEKLTDSGVLYAVSRTELKMCWQRNASARDFKECVHNVLGGRISK